MFAVAACNTLKVRGRFLSLVTTRAMGDPSKETADPVG